MGKFVIEYQKFVTECIWYMVYGIYQITYSRRGRVIRSTQINYSIRHPWSSLSLYLSLSVSLCLYLCLCRCLLVIFRGLQSSPESFLGSTGREPCGSSLDILWISGGSRVIWGDVSSQKSNHSRMECDFSLNMLILLCVFEGDIAVCMLF